MQYTYPGNKPFHVTLDSVRKTNFTFFPAGEIWEPTSIEYFYSLVQTKHKNENATIIDVGAQSGLYSLYAKYLPKCIFYAFEPYEETYALLLENLQLNSITNVKAYNYALGSKEESKLLHVPDHFGLNTFGDAPKRFTSWKDVNVSIKRLDDIIPEETPVDYIKCDTEGWEYYVLKGAEKTIRKWKPELFIEINPENLQQAGIQRKDLEEYLQDLHYKPVCIVDEENYHYTYQGP